MIARLARYELPGRRRYLAVCEACRFADMGWKNKEMAKADVKRHNDREHPGGVFIPKRKV